MTEAVIRETTVDDFARLIAIERAAGEAFRQIGMDAIADDPPPSLEDWAGLLEHRVAWVYLDDNGTVGAYLVAERLGDRAHIEQVSVHPEHAHRGIGATLIETASRWADGLGLSGLSLTTFAAVPWNAPYYSRLGFSEVAESQWTNGIRQRVAAESAHGLDQWPRVVMIRNAIRTVWG